MALTPQQEAEQDAIPRFSRHLGWVAFGIVAGAACAFAMAGLAYLVYAVVTR